MKLAPAAAADADTLAALHARSFDEGWSAPDIAALLVAPSGFGLVVHTDASGEIAGFILVRVAADEAEVLTLAVAPEFRRQGLGQVLIEAATLQLAAAGAQSLFLEVAEDNAAGLALYGAAGFTQVGARPGYYRRAMAPAVAALVLRRDLNRTSP